MELIKWGQEVWSDTWENMDTTRRTMFMFDNGLGAVVTNSCMGGSEVTLIKQLEGVKDKYTFMLKDHEIVILLELIRGIK